MVANAWTSNFDLPAAAALIGFPTMPGSPTSLVSLSCFATMPATYVMYLWASLSVWDADVGHCSDASMVLLKRGLESRMGSVLMTLHAVVEAERGRRRAPCARPRVPS